MSLSAGMAEGASVVGAVPNQLVRTPQAQRNQPQEQMLTSNSVDQIFMVQAMALITTYHPTVQVLTVRRIEGKSISRAVRYTLLSHTISLQFYYSLITLCVPYFPPCLDCYVGWSSLDNLLCIEGLSDGRIDIFRLY